MKFFIENTVARWVLLFVVIVPTTILLYYIHTPAYLILGPLLVSMIFNIGGLSVKPYPRTMLYVQPLIGCYIATSIKDTIIHDMATHWAVYVAIAFSTLLLCIFVSFLLAKKAKIDNNTAMWALLPGGATAMVLLCTNYKADIRVVATTQYLRVIMILFTLVIASNILYDNTSETLIATMAWFPAPTLNFLYTILIAISGIVFNRLTKVPSSALLFPLIICAVLKINTSFEVELPRFLLAIVFTLIGINIGSKFDKSSLKYIFKILPYIVLAIVTILSFSICQAFFLGYVMDADLLTGILATSAGGIDTSVIIAAETNSDISVILPIQVLRLFTVLFIGKFLAENILVIKRFIFREKG